MKIIQETILKRGATCNGGIQKKDLSNKTKEQSMRHQSIVLRSVMMDYIASGAGSLNKAGSLFVHYVDNDQAIPTQENIVIDVEGRAVIAFRFLEVLEWCTIPCCWWF